LPDFVTIMDIVDAVLGGLISRTCLRLAIEILLLVGMLCEFSQLLWRLSNWAEIPLGLRPATSTLGCSTACVSR